MLMKWSDECSSLESLHFWRILRSILKMIMKERASSFPVKNYSVTIIAWFQKYHLFFLGYFNVAD